MYDQLFRFVKMANKSELVFFNTILPLLTLATLNLDNGNLGFVGDLRSDNHSYRRLNHRGSTHMATSALSFSLLLLVLNDFGH